MTTIIVSERMVSRRRVDSPQSSSIELAYNINDPTGASFDETAAMNELTAFAPVTYNGMAADSFSVEPISDSLFYGAVRYANTSGGKTPPQAQPINQAAGLFSFDTGSGSTRLMQAITQSSYAPAGQTAPNYQGAIAVVDGVVQGVDIVEPVYHFSESWVFNSNFVNGAYKATVRDLAGTVNNASFKGFNAGEVLFLGATGASRTDGLWEMNYKFASRPNRTNITIGSITVPLKGGWDFIWTLRETTEDAASNRLVETPVAAYVAQVYYRSTFAALGIGT